MSRDLTDRQRELLLTIWRLVEEHGSWPTYRQLMRALDIHSTNGIAGRMKGLAAKGWVTMPAGGNKPVMLRGVRLVPEWDDTPDADRLAILVQEAALKECVD